MPSRAVHPLTVRHSSGSSITIFTLYSRHSLLSFPSDYKVPTNWSNSVLRCHWFYFSVLIHLDWTFVHLGFIDSFVQVIRCFIIVQLSVVCIWEVLFWVEHLKTAFIKILNSLWRFVLRKVIDCYFVIMVLKTCGVVCIQSVQVLKLFFLWYFSNPRW